MFSNRSFQSVSNVRVLKTLLRWEKSMYMQLYAPDRMFMKKIKFNSESTLLMLSLLLFTEKDCLLKEGEWRSRKVSKKLLNEKRDQIWLQISLFQTRDSFNHFEAGTDKHIKNRPNVPGAKGLTVQTFFHLYFRTNDDLLNSVRASIDFWNNKTCLLYGNNAYLLFCYILQYLLSDFLIQVRFIRKNFK